MTRLLRFLLLIALTTSTVACADDPEPTQRDMSALDLGTPPEDMLTIRDMTPDMMSAQDTPKDLPDDLMDQEPDLVTSTDMSDPMDMAPDLAQDMPRDMWEHDAGEDMPASGMPLAGFGALMGDCQQIDDELMDAGPSSFRNTLDFAMDSYGMEDLMALTAGGQAIIAAGNAGGNSILSEVFAFEVLARCEGATLLETETTIDYFNEMGKITDLLVEIDGERVGVSVVRAIAFPFEDPYPESEAKRVLEKKLGDILLSSENVKPNHAWVKQILSVIAYTPQHADQIEAVYQTLDAEFKSDTIVYITITEGADRPIYFND
jgi:hypothetical protein